MAGQGRPITHRAARSPRAPIFYAEPDKPGKSRHQQCFRRAGVDPKRAKYKLTEGPCWICDGIGWQYVIYTAVQQIGAMDRAMAALLKEAGTAGFVLAEEVRSAVPVGVIARTRLEQDFPKSLQIFRSAFQRAHEAAQPSGENPHGWSHFIVENPVPTAKPQRKTRPPYMLNVGPILKRDPSQLRTVHIEQIHSAAGWLTYAARAIVEAADHGDEQLTKNKGKDADDLAIWLAQKMKASPSCLTEVIARHLSSDGKLTETARRRANAMSGRYRKRAFDSRRQEQHEAAPRDHR